MPERAAVRDIGPVRAAWPVKAHSPTSPARLIRERPGVVFVCLWAGVLNATATAPLSPALPAIAAEIGGGTDGSFLAQMVQSVSAIGMIAGATVAAMAASGWGGAS